MKEGVGGRWSREMGRGKYKQKHNGSCFLLEGGNEGEIVSMEMGVVMECVGVREGRQALFLSLFTYRQESDGTNAGDLLSLCWFISTIHSVFFFPS